MASKVGVTTVTNEEMLAMQPPPAASMWGIAVKEVQRQDMKLVRITDDGAGMGPEDLALAFTSHATSKLRDASDLEHIGSLGFRGEALASIGSVSRARILSRPEGVPTGWEIENDGGKIGPVVEAGAARGTTVEVRDLFFNTPARRNFLKRPSTELGRALDILQRLAMAHVGVGFVVTHDKKRVFDVEKDMDLRARVRRIFGAELADALVPVEAEDRTTVLSGFVAPPRFARGDTSRQMWFLNGRPLRDKVLIRCTKQAFRGLIPDGRQPICFLRLFMDPAGVDVNVHPTKSEVRFREERRLFGFLIHYLREAALSTDMATPGERLLDTAARREERSDLHLPDPGPMGVPTESRGREELRVFELPGPRYDEAAPGDRAVPASEEELPSAQGSDAAAWAARDEFRGPFLQVDRTYILRTLPDGFEIIDQHALHERMTYEGLKEQVRAGKVEVQRLLVPTLVELARSEVESLEAHLEALAKSGIELAVFGPTTIAVHGLPALLRRPDPEGLVRDLVGLVASGNKVPELDEILEHVLHSRACRGSIMAGDALSQEDMRALLERASKLESDQTCPHGRPTRVRFTLADLEKAFHRR